MNAGIVPTFLPKFVVMGMAEGFAQTFAYVPGASLDEFIHRLGGSLIYEDKAVGTHLVVTGSRQFMIRTMRQESALCDYSQIAIGIGHYFLHSLMGKKKMKMDCSAQLNQESAVGGNPKRQIVLEAHWFAAAFLMPAKKLKAARQTNGDTLVLAKQFQVTQEVMRTRLKDLDIAPKTWKPF